MTRLLPMLARAAVVCCLALSLTAPAAAQAMWTFQGVSFPARDGWCSTTVNQGTDAEPDLVLEVRPCGQEFPYMSLDIGLSGNQPGPRDATALYDQGVAYANTTDAKALVTGVVTDNHGACSEKSYSVDTNPVPGVKGFTVSAAFLCSKAEPKDQTVRNFTSFAVAPDNAVWIVAFDYPLAPLSGGDIAMLQSAVATIQFKR